MNNKEPKLIHVLICDDIRREADGKMTLVGVHSGQFNFGQVKWPNNSKSLAIWVKFLTHEQKPIAGEIRLFCPEHEANHARFKFNSEKNEKTDEGYVYSLNFRMPRGFYTSHAGRFLFQYKFLEDDWKRLAEIKVVEDSK